jgi:hypothetical protein
MGRELIALARAGIRQSSETSRMDKTTVDSDRAPYRQPSTTLAAKITPNYIIIPARVEHVYELAANLRTLDLVEITSTGGNPKKSLWRGFRNSIICETALVDAKVAAMWGLAVGVAADVSPLSYIGRPWLLTSPAVEAVPVAFIKEGKKAVARMLVLKSSLENYVLARYVAAIRALKIMGFTVDDPQPLGFYGEPYCRFHIER